jgi:hypothetical protein
MVFVLPPKLTHFLPNLGRISKVSQRPQPLLPSSSASSKTMSSRRAFFVDAMSLLSFAPFKSSKDSSTPAPLQGPYAHTVLSLLRFSHAHTPNDILPFFLSPADGEIWDALLAILLLKKLLAEPLRVFNNPVKILQWILLQII